MPAIAAGYEAGFLLPGAGYEKEWIEKNMDEFERLAENGDDRMKGLVEDIKQRKLDA